MIGTALQRSDGRRAGGGERHEHGCQGETDLR